MNRVNTVVIFVKLAFSFVSGVIHIVPGSLSPKSGSNGGSGGGGGSGFGGGYNGNSNGGSGSYGGSFGNGASGPYCNSPPPPQPMPQAPMCNNNSRYAMNEYEEPEGWNFCHYSMIGNIILIVAILVIVYLVVKAFEVENMSGKIGKKLIRVTRERPHGSAEHKEGGGGGGKKMK